MTDDLTPESMAARYQWLRQRRVDWQTSGLAPCKIMGEPATCTWTKFHSASGDDLDAEIDKAIAAEGSP